MQPTLRAALVTEGLVASATVAGTNLMSSSPQTPIARAAEVREGVPGSFVAISSYRTMDTRLEDNSGTLGDKLGRTEDDELTAGLARARLVQFEQDDPVGQFPDEAITVTYNVTVTETEGAGFVQVEGYNFAGGETSTVNWSEAGQTIANSGVTRLTQAFDDVGAVGIYLGGTAAAKAHVILDITGYYLPVADGT
ncbi:hypothetical protein [Ilumatobacter sp.]|uniref:hypothetical protein n=1 Tax=Ilumatobacter sp. TaxID=1967498 RepID=UPI003AF62538